jgi:ElaB/YqjD/DUF883 family membrane-anchored ribosome-binding protein
MKNASPKSSATNSLRHLGNRVSAMRDRANEFVQENSEAARERVAEAYDDARRRVTAGVKTTRQTVRRHPLESVAIAFGIGLVVGTLSTLLASRDR